MFPFFVGPTPLPRMRVDNEFASLKNIMSSWWCQLGVFGVGIQLLVGAFKYFLFSSLLGEDEPILTNTNQFQLAWFNHQLAATRRFFCFCGFSTRCLFRFHPPPGCLWHAGKHAGCQWPAMALSRSLGASIASTCGVSSEPEADGGNFWIYGWFPVPPTWRMGCRELGSVVGIFKPWMEGVPWIPDPWRGRKRKNHGYY